MSQIERGLPIGTFICADGARRAICPLCGLLVQVLEDGEAGLKYVGHYKDEYHAVCRNSWAVIERTTNRVTTNGN